MESLTILGIGMLILILICFMFTQMHLKEINVKNQQNMNGISHVWGLMMEMKLDLQILENKWSIPNLNEGEEIIDEMAEE